MKFIDSSSMNGILTVLLASFMPLVNTRNNQQHPYADNTHTRNVDVVWYVPSPDNRLSCHQCKFTLLRERMTWSEAVVECGKLGSGTTLITAHSQADNHFFAGYIKRLRHGQMTTRRYRVWLGGYTVADARRLVWLRHGHVVQAGHYSRLHKHQRTQSLSGPIYMNVKTLSWHVETNQTASGSVMCQQDLPVASQHKPKSRRVPNPSKTSAMADDATHEFNSAINATQPAQTGASQCNSATKPNSEHLLVGLAVFCHMVSKFL